jgi:large subunit ribosomal protein L9
MKVILKQYVYKHGVAGDIVEVANGFARNFLIPRGLAVKATPQAIKQNERLLTESAMRRNELNDQLVAVSNQIDGTHLVFGRKAGSNGKLYGPVTSKDIADELLAQTGVDINRRRISEQGLRELGTFDVPIRMGQDLSPVLQVTVVREEDLHTYLENLAGSDDAVVEGEDGDVEGEHVEETEAPDADAIDEAVVEGAPLDAEPALATDDK